MGSELKELHDRLLEQMPEEATHEEAECPICLAAHLDQSTDPEGHMSDKTFTQSELEAAVAAATSDMQKQLDVLKDQMQETEVGKAVAEAVAAKDTEIEDLAEKLAEAEKNKQEADDAKAAAEKALEDLEGFWAGAIEEHEVLAWMDAVKAERIEKVRELEVFADDWFEDEANTARFATMSDDDFKAQLESYGAIKAKYDSGSSTTKIPGATAMTAARTQDPGKGSAIGAVRELRSARRAG